MCGFQATEANVAFVDKLRDPHQTIHMRGGAMKETYRVPRPPEIAGNGNLVNSKDSEELLSVLGFRATEASAVKECRQGGTRRLHAIKTPCTGPDDKDQLCPTGNPIHITWEEPELTANAK